MQKEMEEEEKGGVSVSHVLVLLYPAQGHINPMVQFAKRLHTHGLKVTLATTHFIAKHMKAQVGPIAIVSISDGYDQGGYLEAGDPEVYHKRFEAVGSRTLAELIEKQAASEWPFSCLVYDTAMPWAIDVGQQMGLVGLAFSTQSCAIFALYYYMGRGMLTFPPLEGAAVSMPGLPPLHVSDLPSFVLECRSYQPVLALKLAQFSNLDKASWVLFNTIDKLESEVAGCMGRIWPIKTIGPSIPSMYLDKSIDGDNDYGLNYWKADSLVCMDWLNAQATGSVVYMSFGSIATLGPNQMEELAWGVSGAKYNFLWVVRSSEVGKLPPKFKDVATACNKGLILTWAPQLEVLAHQAIGCFVTHCGWNSILEALSLGVPMVGVPQWTDQPTNAKYVEDVWGVGLRASRDREGIVRRDEIEKCIKEVMEGEKGDEIKTNARKCKEWMKESVTEGGSTYKNIEDLVVDLVSSKVKRRTHEFSM